MLFVVLVEEHLLCENLMEQDLSERCGIRTATLTLSGCAQRLSLGKREQNVALNLKLPPLLLDGKAVVTVVYFRAGISPQCFGTPSRWAARALIEQSAAIKCPSAGWWLAGTKVAQCALSRPATVDRLLPLLDPHVRAQLVATQTHMWPVGDAAAERRARADVSKYILKKEPLGVWAGSDLIEQLDRFQRSSTGAHRDYFIMNKVRPVTVKGVRFVRGGRMVGTASGVQELGLYGTFLGDGKQEEFATCVGYLVRTKPESEVDGGVCKGVAVLDSIITV